MTALLIIAAAAILIAIARTISHHSDRVIDEILAAELRQIDRERMARQHDANLSAKWRG